MAATAGGKEEESRLFRVRKTVNQMLANRGYNVAQDDLKMTPEAFHDMAVDGDTGAVNREKLTCRWAKVTDPTQHIYVFFPQGNNIGVKTVRTLADRMKDANVTRGIMIVENKMSTFALKGIADLAHKYLFEHFKESELLVDITQHVLVPEHRLLSDEDKQELLRRYKLREQQLPRIQVTDPIARYYGMQRGQVVRIVRPSETAGRYVTYRLVV